MDHNVIKSVRDTTTSISEVVTVSEVKARLRLEGFTGASGTEVEFNDDNALLLDIIRMVREQFEKLCGITITPNRTKEVVLTNLCGGIELPYGPIGSITAITDVDGNDKSSEVQLRGNLFKFVDAPLLDNLKVTYTCGYGTSGTEPLPASIKMDMIRACCYWYLNAGDGEGENFISRMAIKYSRNTGVI